MLYGVFADSLVEVWYSLCSMSAISCMIWHYIVVSLQQDWKCGTAPDD